LLQASAFKLVVVVLGDLISEDGLQTVGYGRNHYASYNKGTEASICPRLLVPY